MISAYPKKSRTIKTGFILVSLLFLLSFLNKATAQSNAFTAPSSCNATKNPLEGNTESLKYAKVLYTSYCGPCHGDKGKGNGVAAAGMSVKPADHSSAEVQKQSDGSIFWKMSEGHNPMPAYKNVLNENQRWALVNYIRTLVKTTKK